MISKNLPSNINSSHIGKPRSWWKTTLHYQLHPGAHGKIHRTPEGETNPRSKCWEIMRYTVYHLLEIRYIRAVAVARCGQQIVGWFLGLRANITFVALQDQPTEALKPQSMTTQGLYGRNILAL